MPNALQIAQGRQTPLTAGLFMAVRDEAPLFSAFDVRTTSGTSFLSLAITSLPSSSFANLGEGFTSSEGTLELREFDCSLIGGQIRAELISADLWNKNHTGTGYTWFDLQTMLKVKADVQNVERQIILGRTNDAKGFPGAKELTPFSGGVFTMAETSAAYNFQRSVLNVAGTTSDTASSAYSFVFGEMESQLILGNDSGGELITIGDIITQDLAPDPVNNPTKLLRHEVAQLQGFVGLSVSGFNQQIEGQSVPTQYSVRRAANITADAGKTMTDTVMDKLSRSHGTGRRPSLFAMSHRSGEQLAASRSATAVNFNMGQSGDASRAQANIYPEPPENWRGIPIVYPLPSVIGDTDAIES